MYIYKTVEDTGHYWIMLGMPCFVPLLVAYCHNTGAGSTDHSGPLKTKNIFDPYRFYFGPQSYSHSTSQGFTNVC